MKIIIFAGGTGKRFWPISRKSSPKQFQSVIDDKPLIRLKYEYLSRGYQPEDIFLSTGQQYEKEVKDILPELPEENFILEPEMRDNGPAVLYAVLYVQQKFSDEVVSIQWADHYIREPELFAEALKEGEKYVEETNKAVVIGVPARFPNPNRGYIKFGKSIKSLSHDSKIELMEFKRFVEKPTLEVAREYIRSGDYAWNPAYSIAKPSMFVEKYKKFAPEMYHVISRIAESGFADEKKHTYSHCEKIGMDYIFSENLSEDEAVVINVDMGWNDVGEFVSLKEALESFPDDVVTQGQVRDLGSKDIIAVNQEPEKLLATIGLEDLIVVNTKDVVFVCKKSENGRVKELLKELGEDERMDAYL